MKPTYLILMFCVSACSMKTQIPPPLPADMVHANIYRLDVASEFNHIESTVIAAHENNFRGGYKRVDSNWIFFDVQKSQWKELTSKFSEAKFNKMALAALPYAVGGVALALESRIGGREHRVVRINPQHQPEETEFMLLVKAIQNLNPHANR